ncbi:MAG: YbaB/EbfC family nucleoid-associated protein [Acidimicrobiia bacterium]|nr:YbaB/EbfC family nucleoid-associated protein [Acidimicrobiia bacterium]
MNRGPDMRQLMRQAQKMQEQMMAAQQELATRQFEGTSGGGMVKAVVSGGQELLAVEISPEVIDPSDPEMLGDLVVAAVNAAMRQVQEAAGDSMGGMDLGGLGGLLG